MTASFSQPDPDPAVGISRREALARGASLAAAAAAAAVGACRLGPSEAPPPEPSIRLTARPLATRTSAAPGVTRPLLHETRDGLLYVPAGLDPSALQPLVVFLHGASGNAQNVVGALAAIADEAKCVLLAPESRAVTWDLIYGGVGPDIQYLDAALKWTFARCAIDPARVGLAGFSDGASYALFAGLANGDLMRRIAVFAPGRLVQDAAVGKPPVFVAHGSRDEVFPIDSTGRRYAEQLLAQGYDVTFREFNGGHVMPASLVREAFGFLSGTVLTGAP